ncbi:hypothetical protein [Haloferula sp. BvORR071]|uniref:hypothetical protein n=1 Tax=Haloferula sp. BvORR071 TaxID=1396141 RepID=UPI000697C17C|nr:hypothetical protein [Haloferula sp. BvORR071]
MSSVSVTFDTNVFSHIVRPDSCKEIALKEVCVRIADEIVRKRVMPHVSETIFNLEGIERKDRQSYFGNYRPATSLQTRSTENPGEVCGTFCISPNMQGRPESNPILAEKLEKAREMGFRVLSAPRIGLPRSPLLFDSDFGPRTNEEMGAQQELFFKAGRFVESLGGGFVAAKAIGDKYRTTEDVWYEALKHASKNDAAAAIGEWSDGDSIATHIGYGLDYFCTRDEAKSAGSKSVFSASNRAALTGQFGIKFITPAELLSLLEA